MGDAQNHAAFGGAVELGQHDPGNFIASLKVRLGNVVF